MAYGLYTRLGFGLLASVALSACVFPPSFDGYSEDTDGGSLPSGGSGATAGSSGAGGGSAGSSAGGSTAGGAGGATTGGAAGSATAGTAGSMMGGTGGTSAGGAATGGSAGAGGTAGTGGGSTGPSFGDHCAMGSMCGTGLSCSVAGMMPDPALGSALASFNIQGPTCGTSCPMGPLDCQGPGGEAGKCVGASALGDGRCVPTCNVRTTSVCPTGTDCIHEWGDMGEGTCSPDCLMNPDCLWMGLSSCRTDGLCDLVASPSDPSDCAASGCKCYPDSAASTGTCRIPCENDTDCPMHTATGKQMICPHHPPMDTRGFGFCVVPCVTTADCSSVGGNTICVADGPGSACSLPR